MVKPTKKKKTIKSKKQTGKITQHDVEENREYGITDKLSRLFFSWIKKKKPKSFSAIRVGNYDIKGHICDGTFGSIMTAINIYTNVTVVAKLELIRIKSPQLYNEFIIYEILGSETPGFGKVFHYGPCDNKIYNALIMELLGPDLDDLFVACKDSFSLKTTFMIILQTLKLMRYVHNKHIIYRDVKPENFCIGHRYQNKEKQIHIVDFGLSKLQNLEHQNSETYFDDKPDDYLIGTARYMSINAHCGYVQSKRDDLESLGYMYLYFLLGSLPWMGVCKTNTIEQYTAIANMKISIDLEAVTETLPELGEFIAYVRKLRHNENPDYDYICLLFENAFFKKGFKYDCDFDWTLLMNQKVLKSSIEIDPDD